MPRGSGSEKRRATFADSLIAEDRLTPERISSGESANELSENDHHNHPKTLPKGSQMDENDDDLLQYDQLPSNVPKDNGQATPPDTYPATHTNRRSRTNSSSTLQPVSMQNSQRETNGKTPSKSKLNGQGHGNALAGSSANVGRQSEANGEAPKPTTYSNKGGKKSITIFTPRPSVSASRSKPSTSHRIVKQTDGPSSDDNDGRTLTKSEKSALKELNVVTRRYYLAYLANTKKHEPVQDVFSGMRPSHDFYPIARDRVARSYKNWKTGVWQKAAQQSARWMATAKIDVQRRRAGLFAYKDIRAELLADYTLDWAEHLFYFAAPAVDFNDIQPEGLRWIKCELAMPMTAESLSRLLTYIN